MSFKLDYLVKRYFDAYKKQLFINEENVATNNICVIEDFNNLNDFELQHKLEKLFVSENFDAIDFKNVSEQRIQVSVIAYIMSYSNLP